MKRLLVLSIDRDNDIGTKTNVRGPVMGRADMLAVAEKLILADPEDSDANTLYAAVRLYDQLKKSKSVDVAVVTGDIRPEPKGI